MLAVIDDTMKSKLLRAMPGLKERAKTLIELISGAYFIFADRPLEIEPKAAALLTPETRALIGPLHFVPVTLLAGLADQVAQDHV